jgi:hypothetical protein
MSTLFDIWHSIQTHLFPALEQGLDPLSDKERRFVEVICLLDFPGHMRQFCWRGFGRKKKVASTWQKPLLQGLSFSKSLGHVPIIDHNPRHGEKILMDPATKSRFAERSSVERVNSNLKDNYGGRSIRVKGASRVMTHLMLGIVSIAAMQIFRLLR